MVRLFIFAFCLFSHLLYGKANINQIRREWNEAVKSTPEYPTESYSGRGIVIPAGGRHYLVNAYINLNMLREQGCQLPVEIWYIGQDEIVLPIMNMLENLNAVCKDITNYFHYPIKSYEVKVHAIVASSFKEVMLLDADNVVFKNPEFLFDTDEFIQTGALFWPDIQTFPRKNIMWKVLGLPAQIVRAQESGQIVINKELCWVPLQLCLHMNKNSEFFYKQVYGDKDTFFLSWKALNYPYTMVPHMPGVLKKSSIDDTYGYGQIQRDLLGNPLFCHTTVLNWAERNTFEPLFTYYTLPDKHIDDFRVTQETIFDNFQTRFPYFEMDCINHLKKAISFLS